MPSPRAIHLPIGLLALAASACANIAIPEQQVAVVASPSQPRLLIVRDFQFSPDVIVVDREFGARLEAKLGTNVDSTITKAIAVKRVNAEIAATIILVTRAAGLHSEPDDNSDVALKNGTIILGGDLHALDKGSRAQRAAQDFGAGTVAADVTLSQVSGGGETQLLAFTAQPPSGRPSDFVMSGQVVNATIASELGAHSVPDVSLSPQDQALARGLGRVIADKIIAYGKQQGWPVTPVAAAGSEDERSMKGRSVDLPVPAARLEAAATPTNAIPCKAFTKNDRGNWYVKGPVTFDIGTAKNQTLQNQAIPPKFFTIGGVDLYTAIQKQCGR
jgi:hypothetical protein